MGNDEFAVDMAEPTKEMTQASCQKFISIAVARYPRYHEEAIQHTIAIDTVAKAKGSPRMLSVLIPLLAPVLLPLLSIPPFILRSDGECSDPYDGIEMETGPI